MPTFEFEVGKTAAFPGDTIKIEFDQPFRDVKSFNSFSDRIQGEEDDRFFKKYFRWSPDQSYSSWIDLTDKELSSLPFEEGSDIWIEFKYERAGSTEEGDLYIQSLELDYDTASGSDDEPEAKPKSLSCHDKNYCGGITFKKKDRLFKPNDALGNLRCLYDKMNAALTDMQGICVQYMKVDPYKDSGDGVLKEYSLYKATDMKEIRAVVSKGELPDNQFEYSGFDMGFVGETEFELQIPKEYFERAFGQFAQPQQNDIIYVPLMNKIWEVNSSYLSKKELQHQGSFYKIRLIKWQNKQNVILGNNNDVKNNIDDLTKDFEEVLGSDYFEEEEQKITKPKQYKTIGIGKWDHIRDGINNDLNIVNEEINNYATLVAKYYYDLSTVDHDTEAVKYKESAFLGSGDDISTTFWFRWKRDLWDGTYPDHDTLLEGASASSGVQLNLKYDTSSEKPSYIKLVLNGEIYSFDDSFPDLVKDRWYATTLNISNTHRQVSLYIWELKENEQSTDLRLLFDQTFSLQDSVSFKTSEPWRLKGGTIKLTNLRIFSAPIEIEKQVKILNQYNVKDSHLLRLIDNAIPPLTFDRQNVR